MYRRNMSANLQQCAVSHWVCDAEIWFTENKIAINHGIAFGKVNNLFCRI